LSPEKARPPVHCHAGGLIALGVIAGQGSDRQRPGVIPLTFDQANLAALPMNASA
jgi:hypothetical protein